MDLLPLNQRVRGSSPRAPPSFFKGLAENCYAGLFSGKRQVSMRCRFGTHLSVMQRTPKGTGGPARYLRVRYGSTDPYESGTVELVMGHIYRYDITHTSPGILQPAEPIRLLKISSSSKPNHRPKADKVL